MKKQEFKFLWALLPICLSFLIQANAAKAQTVSGVVTDANNAPVAAARVSLTARNTVVADSTTASDGRFSLTANNQTDLILRVAAADFAVFEQRLNGSSIAPLAVVLTPQDVRANVTVSVTGTQTRLAETPASVIVLNRQTLDNTAAQTVDDALRQVPGFTLFRRSSSKTANPTTQGANLRGVSGSGASRAAVLFDGVSVNDAFGGWTYWNRIPRLAIEQVEVLRGGASSIYGSGGLSGAVNILTRRTNSNAPILRAEFSGGTQETVDGSFYTAFGKNGWTADVAAETFQTAGYFPIPESERGAADRRANSRHNNAFLTIAKTFGDNARIFGRGNLFAERRDNGTSLQNNRTYFRQAVAGADFNNELFGAFNLRVSTEAQVYDQTFSAVSANRNTENLNRIQRVPSGANNLSVLWSRLFTESHTVSASFDARLIRGFSDETAVANNRAASTTGAGGNQNLYGFFAQDFWRVNDKLNVNFGGRFDFWTNENAVSTSRVLASNQTTVINFPDKTQRAFSPSVGAVYQFNQNFALTGSFNRSFRAPTLNELYRAFRVGNILTQANENLSAERAANGEIGGRYSFLENKFSLRGTAFVTEVSNPVVSVTLSQTPNLITRQRQNLGTTRSRGIELDFEANLRRDLQLSAGYLFVDARVNEFPANAELVNNFLPQIPRQQLTFQIFYRPNKFSIGLQSRFSAAQFDDDQNQFRLRPFAAFDVFASYRLPRNVELFTASENIFNNRYDIALTPNRNIAAPRTVRIGLRFNLSRK